MEIKSRFSAVVLFSFETDSVKICLEAAVKAKADLSGAYLSDANLRGADLSRAYLSKKFGKILDHLQIGPIGSRRDTVTFIKTDKTVRVLAGCFNGSLDEFTEAVAKKHDNNKHGRNYRLALALVASRFET